MTIDLTFKFAETDDEIEQIHRLNYRTFVEEIPQHPPNPERRLVDKFHEENSYCICLADQRLVGMITLRDRRPFSLDAKVPDLDRWLPAGAKLCEIRLLAVEPAYRGRTLFAQLLCFAATEGLRRGYTLGLASGTLRQTKLYQHLGFVPFYQPVGAADARFQPMYLPLQAALALLQKFQKSSSADLMEQAIKG
ncbi:MAG: GNAT family N-acetyltransferase [Caldilineaceae bacterium]|nr:GNAT family N-acetyltransferase [Caldilineaceae bacterium]